MMMNLPCLMASCANFLRPICSYTECQLSFQTGSCPTERTTASYSSCLFWLLLTFLCCRDSFQWTPPLLYQLVLCMFFGTTSLKRDIKKEGVFQPSSLILMNIRNVTTPILVFRHRRSGINTCKFWHINRISIPRSMLLHIVSFSINKSLLNPSLP